MRFLMLAILPLSLLACSEKDEDDADDSDGGTEIDGDSDDDGDGLTYDEELDLGTDPDNADSDGDGYPDGAEEDAGSDPLDDEDGIYACGWPYNADKDDMGAPSEFSGRAAKIGDQVPDTSAYDQCGDEPHVYDFMGQGVPVIIDVSAFWCGPCQGFASYLSGGTDSYGWGNYFPSLPGLIENGDVYWITIMGQNRQGGAPDDSTVEQWYNRYPDDHIPVLADGDVYPAVVGWWPTFMVTDEDGTILSSAEGDGDRYLEALYYVEDEWGN